MYRVLIIFLLASLCSVASGQTNSGYQLKFKLTGLKDTTVYLGYYYAEGTYVRDTARVNNSGEFMFDGKEYLPQGIYFLVLDKTRMFEPGFVIGANQHFTLESTYDEIVKNMVVKGDPDNKLFFDNMHFQYGAEQRGRALYQNTSGYHTKRRSQEERSARRVCPRQRKSAQLSKPGYRCQPRHHDGHGS
jgi:hypothetical protein